MRSSVLLGMLPVVGACLASGSMDSGASLLRETKPMVGAARAAPLAGAGSPAMTAGVSGVAGATGVRPVMMPMASSSMAVVPPAAAGAQAPPSAGVGATAAAAGSAGAGGAVATMPAAGSGGAAGGGAAAMPSGPSMGTLTLKFTTKSYGGQYAPLNYGAVWFESSDGKFIKTVKRWAGLAHATDLGAWTKASGGWGGLFGGSGNAADMMDAMSSATLRQHESHTVMWNMKGADKQIVPDGEYVAVVELTEDRAAMPGPILRVKFKKGSETLMIDAPDETSFSAVSLTYQP